MLYEADPGDLIEFAKRWASQGDAVTEQIEEVVNDPGTDEVNPAAIELARGRIQGLNQGVDLAIDEYLTRYRELA